ncbi:ParM/StbA family protein [Clostridium estertheticum]|uniref:ParM/StbA family protein n=1 Tax=Clostridium estertheticum TaxID=238834 RepID=UPI001C7CB8DC|nr:ParM/StbA family protein [Clostridium estertheticum]MBX4271977.1 ParM/StbA family protein [Clostridium estertheticum]WLC80754.1 ParM/StbA family protein [Clostridium estertheticum]
MNYIKGIDIGIKLVRLSDGTEFSSTIKKGTTLLNGMAHIVTWKNNEYVVGDQDGAINPLLDKVDTDHYQLLLLTAVAVAVPSEQVINISIVTGVPIGFWGSLSQKFYNTIINMGTQGIVIDGKKKSISINDCIIFAESCFPYIDQHKYSLLKTFVIDIGDDIVNCSMWNGVNLEEHKSFPNAMISILQSLATKIARNHSVVVDAMSIDYLMENDLDIYYGEKGAIDVNALKKATLEDYTKELVKSIKIKFKGIKSMGACDSIRLIGNASIPLKDYLFKDLAGFKDTIVLESEPQFVNARIYDALANLRFGNIKSKGYK